MKNIYESEIFAHMPDYSMHPGGLRLTDRAIRLAKLEKGMAVADIGCGTGSTAAYLSSKYALNMVGLELSEPLLETGLKNNPGLHLLHWDCRTLPFEPESLDAVLFECSLSVIGYAGPTLAESALALKPNGTLIISDLMAKRSSADNRGVPPTLEKIEAHLDAFGFNIIVIEDHTPALMTYAAELIKQCSQTLDACQLFGMQFDNSFKLSDFCYTLILARKKSN